MKLQLKPFVIDNKFKVKKKFLFPGNFLIFLDGKQVTAKKQTLFDSDFLMYEFLDLVDYTLTPQIKKQFNLWYVSLNRYYTLYFLKKKKIFFLKNTHRSFWFFRNIKVSRKFLNLFTKHGLSSKYSNVYGEVFFHLYNNFVFYKKDYVKKYNIYSVLFNLSRTDLYFWTHKFLFELFELYLHSLFGVFIYKQPKFIRKKTKKKFSLKYSYLPAQKRLKYIFYQIINYSSYFSYYNFSLRLYNSLFHTLMNWKQSFLYKQKINTCKTILKMLKTDKN